MSTEFRVGKHLIVKIVPFSEDNYSYVVVDESENKAALIDAVPAQELARNHVHGGLQVICILTTHKHLDHSAGNSLCQKLFPRVPIIGSAYEDTPGVTKSVQDQNVIPFTQFVDIKAIHVPTHTKGHLAFIFTDSRTTDTCVFTGDFLFLAGCGRFFEGDGLSMKNSILKLYNLCDQNAWMFPGHEYSLTNLKFAKTIEKHNPMLDHKLEIVQNKINQKLPAVPSTLKEELLYNPFVKCALKFDSLDFEEKNSIENTLTLLRNLKNKFTL